MTFKQRAIVTGLACTLILSGFAFGRFTDSPKNTLAEENRSALTTSQPQAVGAPGSFYLQSFKQGYDDGINSSATGEIPTGVSVDPAGYNEGFKQGYADAYKTQTTSATTTAPVVYRRGQQVVYRSAAPAQRRKNSKLKTVLTIAAPAAIGAGIGAIAGGGKGAGIGALIGGGGGAAYHLYKNRRR